jgi:hypothetical protein
MKNLSRQSNTSDLFNLAIDTEYIDRENNIDIFYSYDGLNVNKIEDMLDLSDSSDLDKIEELSKPYENFEVIAEEEDEESDVYKNLMFKTSNKYGKQYTLKEDNNSTCRNSCESKMLNESTINSSEGSETKRKFTDFLGKTWNENISNTKMQLNFNIILKLQNPQNQLNLFNQNFDLSSSVKSRKKTFDQTSSNLKFNNGFN